MRQIFARPLSLMGQIALLIAFFSGCTVFNPAEELPVYVTLRSPGVLLRDGKTFVSSLGVRDAWIDQGDGSIGIFKFPITFPVYKSEGGEITVSGGILNSGLGLSRNKYPFWKPQTHSIANTEALDTLVIEPVFEYINQDSLLYFAVNEDFESGNNLDLEARTDLDEVAPLVRSSERYEGSFAGEVKLNSLSTKLELESAASFFIPNSAINDAYAEITFKGDLPFVVGIKTTTQELTDNILFYADEWTTVYVHIGEFVRQASVKENVVLFLRGSGTAGQKMLFDNIRVVQFK